jgi:alginate O-acetyltransferase complex protein AlgI
MVFSSPLFLFLFLPVVLTVYLCLPGLRLKNAWLLLVSVIFYAWGEVGFVLLMLGSTLMNYGLGIWVDKKSDPISRKSAVALAVVINIGLLAFFKYANFVVATLNALFKLWHLPALRSPNITLPIGISFFTFHALSYVMDVYRRKWKAATNPQDVALYIFFFPQLIAGPILRWSGIAPQLLKRAMSRELFAEGIRRFVGGLTKKVFIANIVAMPADQLFKLAPGELSMPLAWLGIVCYTLQIYFDFSGYSDMAIGLGKMFGFDFMENFNFPYISESIKDFWRRWHISLSSWFRDYLYIPMGGNRCSEPRNYFNLVTVFFLCGLWHGASWTFVAWGLYHGAFLVLERTRFGNFLDALPRPLRHIYALLAVMLGWVLFRADSFPQALAFTKAMFGLGSAVTAQPLGRYLTHQVSLALVFGVLFSMPLWPWLKHQGSRLLQSLEPSLSSAVKAFGMVCEIGLIMVLLGVSASWLASGTYNPFIYFRF